LQMSFTKLNISSQTMRLSSSISFFLPWVHKSKPIRLLVALAKFAEWRMHMKLRWSWCGSQSPPIVRSGVGKLTLLIPFLAVLLFVCNDFACKDGCYTVIWPLKMQWGYRCLTKGSSQSFIATFIFCAPVISVIWEILLCYAWICYPISNI
jgi:hypothetical protein